MDITRSCPRCGTAVTAVRADRLRGICPVCLLDAITQPEPESARSPLELLEGQDLGNYRILGLVGSGGMGVVYRARQKGLERVVALKVLNPRGEAGRDEVERFFREARAAARLQHPNIVPIHEVANDKGYYFFTMELVEGETLASRIDAEKVTPRDAAALLAKIARAVHYAHEQGIIHRDLKPANILIDRAGEPKVMDFGLAKDISSSAGLTATGTTMGTPAYMPPEQAEAEEVDPRSDVYSLGAVLYECLAGLPPFLGDNAVAILQKVLHTDPIAPRRMRPEVPVDLETICLKAMRKERDHRYGSALALAEDLDRFQRGEPVIGRRPGFTYHARRFVRRYGIVAGLLLTVAALAAAMASMLMNPGAPDPSGPPPLQGRALADSLVSEAEQEILLASQVRAAEHRARREERLANALRLLNEAGAADSAWAQIPYLRGVALRHLYRHAEATDAFTQAILLDPDHADARFVRAVANSEQLIDVVVFLNPPDAYRLGTLRDDEAWLDEHGAPPARREVVTGLRECIESYYLVTEEMIAARMDPVREENPETARLIASLLAHADAALMDDPSIAQAYALRGLAAQLQGPTDPECQRRSAAAFREALTYEPNDLWILTRLTFSLSIAGDIEEARRVAQSMTAMAPEADPGYLCAALTAPDAESRDAALARAREVTRRLEHVEFLDAMIVLGLFTSEEPQLQFMRAMTDNATVERVLATYDRLIEMAPDHAFAHFARGMIRTLRREEGGAEDLRRFAALSPRVAASIPNLDRLTGEAFEPAPYDVFIRSIRQTRDQGYRRSDQMTALWMSVAWYPVPAQQRAILEEIALSYAGLGDRAGLLKAVSQLGETEFQAWWRLERAPEFAPFAADASYLELKARYALSAEEAGRRARAEFDEGQVLVQNALDRTEPELRAQRAEWLTAAAAKLERAIEFTPDMAEAHFWLGRARHEQQRWDEAVAAYSAAVEAGDSIHEARFQRVIANHAILMNGDHGVAVFEGMFLIEPDPAVRAMIDADAEALRGARRDWIEIAEGVREYLSLAEVIPDAEHDAQWVLQEYARIGGRMIAHGDAALEANPSNAWGHVLRALGMHYTDASGDAAPIVAEWRRAVERGPNDVMFRMALGGRLLLVEDAEGALREAEEVIRIAPWCELGYVLRARAYDDLDRFEEMWRDLDLALSLAADPCPVRLARSQVILGEFAYLVNGVDEALYRQALGELDAALRVHPDDPLCRIVRGLLKYLSRRDVDGGREDFRYFLERHPNSPGAAMFRPLIELPPVFGANPANPYTVDSPERLGEVVQVLVETDQDLTAAALYLGTYADFYEQQVRSDESVRPWLVEVLFWKAAMEAQSGNAGWAIASLDRLVGTGWSDWARFDACAMFDLIRNDARVAELREESSEF